MHKQQHKKTIEEVVKIYKLCTIEKVNTGKGIDFKILIVKFKILLVAFNFIQTFLMGL